ncbi:MAG: hypothetical protein HC770_09825 [Pseudanabaena sp. CRU_2_10]|nr:hypothetical protein [Pseudanabaena sp. CRU_2_10]
MTIAIQNLQTIAPDTDTELLEELNRDRLDLVSGGFLIYVAAFVGGLATGTSLVTAAGVGFGAGYLAAQEMSNGFVPGPNDEGKYILR